MELFFLLLFSFFWGWRCAVVAENKGRDTNTWFWVGFFTGIFGLIVLVCLPDIEKSPKDDNADKRNIRESTNHGLVSQYRPDVEILRLCNSGKKVTISDIVEVGGGPEEVREKVEKLVIKGLLSETIENGKHFYEAL